MVPLICAMVLAFALFATLIMLGFRKYSSGIPMVGSCRAAISAACHRPATDTDAPYRELRWGAIRGRHPAGSQALQSSDGTESDRVENASSVQRTTHREEAVPLVRMISSTRGPEMHCGRQANDPLTPVDDEEIGHCCLTSEEVDPPTEGKMYA